MAVLVFFMNWDKPGHLRMASLCLNQCDVCLVPPSEVDVTLAGWQVACMGVCLEYFSDSAGTCIMSTAAQPQTLQRQFSTIQCRESVLRHDVLLSIEQF